MFPIKDENPTKGKPILTVTLMVVNIAVFIATYFSGQFEQIIPSYGLKPADMFAGQQLHTLFTSMFLHGGFLHIFGNMLYLWIFGDNIEDVLGRGKFILFYLGCGIIASLAQGLWEPNSEGRKPDLSGWPDASVSIRRRYWAVTETPEPLLLTTKPLPRRSVYSGTMGRKPKIGRAHV